MSIQDQGGILVSKGEYVAAKAGKNQDGDTNEVMSSFRPTDNAKLYASPEEFKTVGFRSRPSVRLLLSFFWIIVLYMLIYYIMIFIHIIIIGYHKKPLWVTINVLIIFLFKIKYISLGISIRLL